MSTITIETCNNGTITRASARALNRALAATDSWMRVSGSSTVAVALGFAQARGVQVRTVDAATLAGPDKARHTREVTRSRKAQAARTARKGDAGFRVNSRPMPFPRSA